MPGPTFFDLARSIDNELKGNFRYPVKNVVAAGSTVLSPNFDAQVECNAAAGAQSIELPDAIANKGMAFFIKKTDAGVNQVVVSCTVGGQLIDGAASFALGSQNDFVVVRSNGVGYSIYAKLVIPLGPGASVYTVSKIKKTDGVSTLNPVDGTLINFILADDGECFFSANGVFAGLSGLIATYLAIYVDGVFLCDSQYFTINGSGGDSTGPVTQSPNGSIFLTAGAHTVELVASQTNISLQADASNPLTLSALYPGSTSTSVLVGPEAARVRTSAQVGINPAVTVSFDTIDAATGDLFVIGSPTKMTAQFGGWYNFVAQLITDGGIDGSFRSLKIRKNGTLIVAEDRRDDFVHNVTQRTLQASTGPILLSAGDYVEVVAETDATDAGANVLPVDDQSIVFAGARLIPGSTTLDISARVARSTNQTIPDATPTTLSLDTVIYDTMAFFAIGSPTKFTIPSSGKYDILALIFWDATANAGVVSATIQLNGAGSIALDQRLIISLAGGYPTSSQVEARGVPLNAGDYIELTLYQDSTAPLDIISDGGVYTPVLYIKKVN